MADRKMKTRCYYSDYVNHMVRFFLSTPESIKVDEIKRRADIANWMAVQEVWYKLPDEDKDVLTRIYKAHYRLAEGVRIYCEQTGTDIHDAWVLVTKTCAAIARKRGLI